MMVRKLTVLEGLRDSFVSEFDNEVEACDAVTMSRHEELRTADGNSTTQWR